MPAPSPSTMPVRPLENGEQGTGDNTRRISHERIPAGVMQASLPPVITRSARPARIMPRPSATAWFDEEQALHTANDGPVAPSSMLIWLAAAFGISRGMVIGSSRLLRSA